MKILKKIPKIIKQIIDMFITHIKVFFDKDKKKYKDAWLFCERGIDAKDNAYWMFKYVKENHPEIKAYYIIDSQNKKDLDKVSVLGDTIEFNSYEQKKAFIMAKYYVCTHYGYITKWNYTLYKKIFGRKKKYIFLQHGITKEDISNQINKLIIDLDIFITATQDEYKSIIENKAYGFNKEVKLTGLARFDNLKNYKTKNQILFMPTWRSYIIPIDSGLKKEKIFLKSTYYKKINGLLNNKKLIDFLEENDLDMIFYPHHETQRFIHKFKNKSKNIKIAKENEYDIQELLKENKLLITDYSSVYFDFAYMKKPVIYYQFDQEEYYKNHYSKGYFNYETDGFGPVIKKEEEVVNELIKSFKNKFKMTEKYTEIVDKTFKYTDAFNCKRIYEEIIKLGD